MKHEGYDIIGDVHGCALTLERLLMRLGYQDSDGYFCHPTRQAIFLGDIIDRGPRVRETLHLVKKMVDAGSAQCILGNHEYNAIGYTTRLNQDDHEPVYVRSHSVRNNRLITETLMQFASYPEEWRMFLNWFLTLPLFIDFGGFRVVHACWDQSFVDEMLSRRKSACMDEAFVLASADKTSFEARCIDRLTRGTDIYLPDNRTIKSKDGSTRKSFRTKFWTKNPNTYNDVVFQPDPLPQDLQSRQLTEKERKKLIHYDENQKPVFVGHYWLQGAPEALEPNVACLDYSAVKYGRLTAYRFDGEQVLENEKFVWEYVDP